MKSINATSKADSAVRISRECDDERSLLQLRSTLRVKDLSMVDLLAGCDALHELLPEPLRSKTSNDKKGAILYRVCRHVIRDTYSKLALSGEGGTDTYIAERDVMAAAASLGFIRAPADGRFNASLDELMAAGRLRLAELRRLEAVQWLLPEIKVLTYRKVRRDVPSREERCLRIFIQRITVAIKDEKILSRAIKDVAGFEFLAAQRAAYQRGTGHPSSVAWPNPGKASNVDGGLDGYRKCPGIHLAESRGWTVVTVADVLDLRE